MKPISQILLIATSVIILATLSACGRVEATDDTEHVMRATSEIADFDLPSGYAPESTAQLLGYTAVSYKGVSDPSHLYLIQSENEADGEELERMLARLAPGSRVTNTRMTVIENRTATVRSQEATVIISEGKSSEKIAYRQVSVAFQGKGGPALLALSKPVGSWDQETVDALLASIQ
jgi:hypothetical protein